MQFVFARLLACNLGAGKLESCGPAPAPAATVKLQEGLQTKWVSVS